MHNINLKHVFLLPYKAAKRKQLRKESIGGTDGSTILSLQRGPGNTNIAEYLLGVLQAQC